MSRKTGITCMILGILLLAAAVALLLYNRNEGLRAAEASNAILPALQEIISESVEQQNSEQALADSLLHHVDPFDEDAVAQSNEMPVINVDGYDYIGYLSIPALSLELPVMSDWDYYRLKIAPCRQFGTAKGNNLVIAAHNYTSHFGRLSSLYIGDMVSFTDMAGNVYHYTVGAIETLPPEAVDAVQNSVWDLTLYTCTYRGVARVTVRCSKIETG